MTDKDNGRAGDDLMQDAPEFSMSQALSSAFTKATGERLDERHLKALTDAAMAAYGRHQTGEADGIPPFEPATCGTRHIFAERALRIIEQATMLGEGISADAIETISNLCDEAGLAFCRNRLARDMPVPPF